MKDYSPFDPNDPAFQADCDKWAKKGKELLAKLESALVEARDRVAFLEESITALRQMADESCEALDVEAWKDFCWYCDRIDQRRRVKPTHRHVATE